MRPNPPVWREGYSFDFCHERERQTDRQGPRGTETKTDSQTDRQTGRQTDRQTDRQTGRQAGKDRDRERPKKKKSDHVVCSVIYHHHFGGLKFVKVICCFARFLILMLNTKCKG